MVEFTPKLLWFYRAGVKNKQNSESIKMLIDILVPKDVSVVVSLIGWLDVGEYVVLWHLKYINI
jgi:hypothetical protein